MKRYKKQSQPLRIENPDNWSFATSKTVRSELWFVNNKNLEDHVLNFLARYQERHSVEIYACCQDQDQIISYFSTSRKIELQLCQQGKKLVLD